MSTPLTQSEATPSEAERSSSKARWFGLLRVAIVGYLLVVLMLTAIQERIIFPATRDVSRELAGADAEFRDVYFPSEDGVQLHGRYYPTEAPRGLIIYFHGNADMVGWLDVYARMLRDEFRHSVFLFDYRGYGRSEGKATGPGVLLDARAAAKQLRELSGVPYDQMVYLGRSIGAGVAIDLAAEYPPQALVLQNAFSTMADVAAHHFRWIPIRILLRVRLDAIGTIGNVQCPILQSHGTRDTLIPFELGKRLFEAANQPKQFFEIPGGGHNDGETDEYYEVLAKFLDATSDEGPGVE